MIDVLKHVGHGCIRGVCHITEREGVPPPQLDYSCTGKRNTINIYPLCVIPFHSVFSVKKAVQWSPLDAHSENLQATRHSSLASTELGNYVREIRHGEDEVYP